jgi:hypothetical protein
MTGWMRAGVLSLIAWVLTCGAAAAAEDLYGQTVTTVTVAIVGTQDQEPALADLVEVRTGAPIDERSVSDIISLLFILVGFEVLIV